MSDTTSQPVKSTRDTRTSFAKVPAVALADPRLTDAAFRLYAVLIDTVNADDADPTVWLSRTHMAERCGKSKSSMKSMDKALDNLIACGYVRLVGERQGQTSRYALTPVVDLDRTYGQSTTPPMVNQPQVPVVNQPHNQEPSTKNPNQEPVNYSTGKPASVKSHTQPPLMQSLQGQSKDALKAGREAVPLPRDLRHRNGDTASDRVVRWVGYAQGMSTRGQAVAWLFGDDPGGVLDVGQWDGSEWVGALRRLIVGFDGVERCDDRCLRQLIDYATTQSEGLDWLVEYAQDGLRGPLSA